MTPGMLQTRLTELASMKIELDPDPTLVGLESFNHKLALLDAYNERLSELFQEALEYKGLTELTKLEAEASYEQAYSEALSGNDKLQQLRSNDLRKAQLDTQLKLLVVAKNDSLLAFTRAEIYLKRVDKRYKDLDAKSERLYKQMDVVRQLLHLDPSLRQDLVANTEKRVLTLKGGGS